MGNKLAHHVNTLTPAAKQSLAAQRGCSFLKTLHLDRDVLSQWKRNNPGGQIAYRMYINDGENSNLERWQEYANRMAEKVKESGCWWGDPLVDIVFVPFNETAQWRAAGIGRLAEVSALFVEHIKKTALNDYPLEVAVGNFSAGNPREPLDWDAFRPALEVADYLVMHQYAKPEMHGDGARWLYQHEEVYEMLRARGLPTPPLILGECGIDHRLWTTDPHYYEGFRKNLNVSQYADQLREFGRRIEGNPDVVAASIFCTGTMDPTWNSYDVAGESVISNLLNENLSPSSVPQRADPPAVVRRAAQTRAAGTPDWLPNVLSQLWSEWRNTPGNTWRRGSDREREEFWAHAGRVGVDVARLRGNRVREERVASPVPVEAQGPSNRNPRFETVSEYATELSLMSDIPASLWQAVIDIETNGCPLTEEGYPVCRFEVAQWRKRVGAQAWGEASQYFRGASTWRGNDDRVNLTGHWQAYHGNQDMERNVIAFAATFGDRDEAFKCSSWGMFQLMGWHCVSVGHASAESMAKSFQDEWEQANGYFLWAQRVGAVEALQRGDLKRYVRIHNGAGAVATVTQKLIRAARRYGWTDSLPPR